MPRTVIRVFRDEKRNTPLITWLDGLEATEPRAYRKCLELILRLEEYGYELRRPLSDALRDGIRELRAKVGTVNYRILYFFFGKNATCLSHGLTKGGKVPEKEIQIAVRRKSSVEFDSDRYTAEWEV